jgi:hypothetical protein
MRLTMDTCVGEPLSPLDGVTIASGRKPKRSKKFFALASRGAII